MIQRTHHIPADQRAWQQVEGELLRSGFPMPLFHRAAWAALNPDRKYRVVSVQNADRVIAQVAVQADVSRVLPGHYFLRVVRFGGNLPEAAIEPMVAALKELAWKDASTLRLSVGVFAREHRVEIAAALERHGFQKSPKPQSYSHTLTMDLRPSEEEVLNSLHKTGRKNLKDAAKTAYCAVPLTDPIYADRLASLQREALARTGGEAEIHPWRALLELSRLHPELSRIVGLFPAADDLQPDHLYGFAWGCMHGDHAEYRAAGTTPAPDRRISISYPLLWDLISWAKREKATWFDLGGVTIDESSDDALGGITNFKRYFSRTVEEVGEEWTIEPHPSRTRLAGALGDSARSITGLIGKLKARQGAA